MYLARYRISHVLDFLPPSPTYLSSSSHSLSLFPILCRCSRHRRPSQHRKIRSLLLPPSPRDLHPQIYVPPPHREGQRIVRRVAMYCATVFSPIRDIYYLISPQTIPVLLQSLSPAVGYSHLPYTPSYEVRGVLFPIYIPWGWMGVHQ